MQSLHELGALIVGLAGLELGRQAAWRPECFRIDVVGLVASFWQLLSAVIAKNLGSRCGA